jgi:hypothetical protein
MSAETRLLCPVKTCSRAFKSKATWTRHLRTVHPQVNLQNQDVAVITLTSFPIRHHYEPIQVSPPTSPADSHEYATDALLYNNVENVALPEAAEEFLGLFDLLPVTSTIT